MEHDNPKQDAVARQYDRKTALLQYLLDAARLYEGIVNFRDKKLIQRYINADEPLHPRRTLDQAYYWTLNTTCADERDRDQTVYRGTAVEWNDKEHAHKINWSFLREVALCPTKYARSESDSSEHVSTASKSESSSTTEEAAKFRWPNSWFRNGTSKDDEKMRRFKKNWGFYGHKHTKLIPCSSPEEDACAIAVPSAEQKACTKHKAGSCAYHEPCGLCQDNSLSVSRVLMVDQLWMWILDQRTILTFFPKRYGSTKHDASDIHKSIRMTLGSNRAHPIRSVFDLALIIIEKCCKTSLDHALTSSLQPQVMDLFSEAVGNVVCTISIDATIS